MRRIAVLAICAAGAALAAAPAEACPACAGRTAPGGAVYLAMAGIIFLPYLIAAVVVPALRKGPPSGVPEH